MDFGVLSITQAIVLLRVPIGFLQEISGIFGRPRGICQQVERVETALIFPEVYRDAGSGQFLAESSRFIMERFDRSDVGAGGRKTGKIGASGRCRVTGNV